MKRNGKGIINNRVLSILLALLMLAGTPAGAFAVDELSNQDEGIIVQDEITADEVTEVKKVDSVEELAEESVKADNDAFFIIDADDNSIDGSLATEEVTADVEDILSEDVSSESKQEDIIEVLDDSGYYTAFEGDGSEVEVSSKFAYQRLRLEAPYSDQINAYGAVNAVYYDGYYLFSYDSEEATKAAYEELIEEYGDSVIVDVPLKLNSIQPDKHALGWGTEFMNMDIEQVSGKFSGEVTVAVIDTGINKNHNIFYNTDIIEGYSFANGDSDTTDDQGHGTAVAGVIAESTPHNVKIMPIKVLDEEGKGGLFEVLMGIKYASDHGADIINLSLGGYADDYSFKELNRQFRYFSPLIISAAGNENQDLDEKGVNVIPAELDSTICVGAINNNYDKCSFSNYGKAVDFAAPGMDVCLADYSNNDGTAVYSGTSFSTPYVASAASLIKAQNTDLSNEELVNALEGISLDIDGDGINNKSVNFGYGMPVFGTEGEGHFFPRKITPTITLSHTSYTYNGKVQTPEVTVKDGSRVLKSDTDYVVSYPSGRKNAGTYTVKVTLKGHFEGSGAASFRITKASNTVKAAGKVSKIKKSKLRKKAQTIAISKLAKISGAQGKLSYAKVSGSNRLSINRTTGSVTVKKKTKKGTYKMKVRVNAAGNSNYAAANRYVTMTVKVK